MQSPLLGQGITSAIGPLGSVIETQTTVRTAITSSSTSNGKAATFKIWLPNHLEHHSCSRPTAL
jgi:hypothetical protein